MASEAAPVVLRQYIEKEPVRSIFGNDASVGGLPGKWFTVRSAVIRKYSVVSLPKTIDEQRIG